MRTILGLDLGTNSIGWALTKQDFNNKKGEILGLGSRIIPMSQDILDTFGKGQSHSQTADRTAFRGVRRLYQRDHLRRERLHRVLNILGFLPPHYADSIDFHEHPGQFKELSNGEREVKITYRENGLKPNGNPGFQFLFMDSFNEMVTEFKSAGHTTQIPHDWTIYYLRKKALKEKISQEELAWVLLNFNQKRGYYQRGEEEEIDGAKFEEFHSLKVDRVMMTEDTNAKGTWYNLILENGWTYRRQSKVSLDNWVGKVKEFIITTTLDKDGNPQTDKEGDVKRSFRAVDSEKDWIAIKSKTEKEIGQSGKTVGEYIYETLLSNPRQRIRGRLVRTIERKFYKDELQSILKMQCELHDPLQDRTLYTACIKELYPRNEAHLNHIKNKDFTYLFLEDIIFYQRPLKSKKSTISTCGYESRTYLKKNKEGQVTTITEGVKCIAKSHPLFQEFRLWQFIGSLQICKHETRGYTDVTNLLFPCLEDKVELFDYLNSRKEIEQKQILSYLIKKKKINSSEKELYRWNYVEDKKYPCNETRALFMSRLKKIEGLDPELFLSKSAEKHLWHIIYSVHDKTEYEKAICSFARKNGVDDSSFLENFRSFKPFSRDYGSYSEKAIKKLLPLMRTGEYWLEANIHPKTKLRIDKIIDGEYDADLTDKVREKTENFRFIEDFQGLPLWLVCYIVYGRHSESSDTSIWHSPTDIDRYLSEFKQHSLRNPIVEQVLTETLRVVRDIWKQFGEGAPGFFDEIHLELGRDMRNPANIRKRISKQNIENENTNNRIRLLLKELMNDSAVDGNVRSHSPSHQEILKIYEEGVYQSANNVDDEIEKIRKNHSPSINEIRKYKLWLDQGYVSPYTGRIIPLSRLFTPQYQIEHIIPQARYFDDSLSNKIICESEVNELKDKRTAYEFLKAEKGRIVELAGGKTVKLFDLDEYEQHCNRYFKGNPAKFKKLMSEEVPDGFIERQMNDSRYISKYVKTLLNHIVREENDEQGTSPNLLPVSGAVTAKLKQDWGLNDQWNEIVAPRFKRLNQMNDSEDYGYYDEQIHAFRCMVPDEEKNGFNKKRIDHRHHALDALIVACVNRRHTQYLNALNAENKNYALRNSLLVKSKHGDYTKTMLLPWPGFPAEALRSLQESLVSFKQNTRVINKTNNKIWKWVRTPEGYKKELVRQKGGNQWAIRKPLHKETVSGAVQVRIRKTVSFSHGLKDWKNIVDKGLKRTVKSMVSEGKDIKSITKYFKHHPYEKEGRIASKVEVYTYTQNATATRTLLTENFKRKQLDSVTDSGIRKILENHLLRYIDEKGTECFDLAFNPDGIDSLNKDILELNGGKAHQPIYKVRIYEEGSKFSVGYSGAKDTKFVEAAKGTNLFFAVYYNDEKKKREFDTIPLIELVEHQKQEAHLPREERTQIPSNPEKGRLLFSLSPNELVYVPTDEELEQPSAFDGKKLTGEQKTRVYKIVSFSGKQCFFIQCSVAHPIVNKKEYTSLNKMERAIDGCMIKESCWKMQVDRLGNVLKVIR